MTTIERGLYAVRLTDGPTSYIFAHKEVPPYYAQKNEYHLLAGTHHSGRLTCGPTKLTRTEGFVNLVNKRFYHQ